MTVQDPLHIAMSLATLTALEIVLGVDNLIVIALLSSPLHGKRRILSQRLGLLVAMFTRLIFLFFALQLTKLHSPISWLPLHITLADIVFLIGGSYLLLQGLKDLFHTFATPETQKDITTILSPIPQPSIWLIVLKISLIDIIFSVDTIMTAVALTRTFWIIATAIVITIMFMMFLAQPLASFIAKHIRIKRLALLFLVLIGLYLILEGFGIQLSRNYLYASVGFSLLFESVNMFAEYVYKSKSKL